MDSALLFFPRCFLALQEKRSNQDALIFFGAKARVCAFGICRFSLN